MEQIARIDPSGKDDDVSKDNDDEEDDIHGGGAFKEMACIVPGGDEPDAGGTGDEKEGDNFSCNSTLANLYILAISSIIYP